MRINSLILLNFDLIHFKVLLKEYLLHHIQRFTQIIFQELKDERVCVGVKHSHLLFNLIFALRVKAFHILLTLLKDCKPKHKWLVIVLLFGRSLIIFTQEIDLLNTRNPM